MIHSLRGAEAVKIAFPLLSDNVLTKIVYDMNHRGFGVATDCIDPGNLASLRSFIENKVADNGGIGLVVRFSITCLPHQNLYGRAK